MGDHPSSAFGDYQTATKGARSKRLPCFVGAVFEYSERFLVAQDMLSLLAREAIVAKNTVPGVAARLRTFASRSITGR